MCPEKDDPCISTSKMKLLENYVKQDKKPDWDSFPQVKPYWEEFKEYKLSEETQELSKKNKINVATKKYKVDGYRKAIRKWQKVEQNLMDRGIRPVTWDWPERSNQWLFANGVTLSNRMVLWSCPQQWKKWPGIWSQQYKRPKKEHSSLKGRTTSLPGPYKTPNMLYKHVASAWSHGKFLQLEIARTRLIAKARQNKKTNSMPYKMT
jgi:hypothetical protein